MKNRDEIHEAIRRLMNAAQAVTLPGRERVADLDREALRVALERINDLHESEAKNAH